MYKNIIIQSNQNTLNNFRQKSFCAIRTHQFLQKPTFFFLLAILLLNNNTYAQQPQFEREMRGVWIATVLNIDWPSKSGLKVKIQKEEMEKQLDYFQSVGMNAVFFQIRPNGNRLYKAKDEPWAEWLKGEQGKKPGYDPLKFMVKACHDRGMELHALVNPYRVERDSSKIPEHKLNLHHQHPEWIVNYGKGTVLNPGIPEVREYIGKLLDHVLKNYEIDGIHYDDYFYPYPYKGHPFPDDDTFEKYGSGFDDKADWRRYNVDELITKTKEVIDKNRPEVKFGVSPFGVWRNAESDSLGSSTKAGAPTYDSLYADTRKWLEKGWVDYIAPQLYWAIGFKPAAYDTLAKWWSDNSFDRHIYVGHAVYKINNNYDSAWYNPSEIPNQIRVNRSLNEHVKGSIYFSAKQVLQNPNSFSDSLRTELYAQKALPPIMKWKNLPLPIGPEKVKVKKNTDSYLVKWKHPKTKDKALFPVYYAICEKTNSGKVHLIKVISSSDKKVLIKSDASDLDFEVYSLNKLFIPQKL